MPQTLIRYSIASHSVPSRAKPKHVVSAGRVRTSAPQMLSEFCIWCQMPKRKYDQYAERARSDGRSTKLSHHEAKTSDIIEKGSANVSRSLKIARGFERQKLGRRRKDAEKNNDEGLKQRLRDETEAAKVFMRSHSIAEGFADWLQASRSERDCPSTSMQDSPQNKGCGHS